MIGAAPRLPDSRTARCLAAAMLAAAFLAGPAEAQYIQTAPINPAYSPLNPLTQSQRNQLILRGRNAEVQANDRVQQGFQFQQNQQIYRQLDRSRPQQPIDTRVPRMKPSCMKKIFGNKYIQTACP